MYFCKSYSTRPAPDRRLKSYVPRIGSACLSACEGETILVTYKHLKEMARAVDCHHIIEKGRQVWHGTQVQLAETPELSWRYLDV